MLLADANDAAGQKSGQVGRSAATRPLQPGQRSIGQSRHDETSPRERDGEEQKLAHDRLGVGGRGGGEAVTHTEREFRGIHLTPSVKHSLLTPLTETRKGGDGDDRREYLFFSEDSCTGYFGAGWCGGGSRRCSSMDLLKDLKEQNKG
jgi:hypothetical protein